MNKLSKEQRIMLESMYPGIQSSVRRCAYKHNIPDSEDITNEISYWIARKLLRGAIINPHYMKNEIIERINDQLNRRRASKHPQLRDSEYKYTSRYKLISLDEMAERGIYIHGKSTVERSVTIKETKSEITSLMQQNGIDVMMEDLISGLSYSEIETKYQIKDVKHFLYTVRRRIKKSEEYRQLLIDLGMIPKAV